MARGGNKIPNEQQYISGKKLIPKGASGFKVAFDEARSKKLGYFTYDGKIFKTIKAGESKEEWESKFRNNLKEETAKLKSYGPGEHLGWKNVKKSNANTDIKTKASGDTTNGEPVQATLREVAITAKRPKALAVGKGQPKKKEEEPGILDRFWSWATGRGSYGGGSFGGGGAGGGW